jgi:glutaminase
MNNSPVTLDSGRASIRILTTISELYQQYRSVDDGEVAQYIPELARVNPDLFGICVVTVDGEVYSVGNVEESFTLQSLVNPFTYGIALERVGRERVLENVGVEPTGNPFHAIVLERGTNRPLNPLVNAGAIAIASMLPGNDPTARFNTVLDDMAAYVGQVPNVVMQVYTSERSTADRNRSIAYLMRNFGRIEGSLEETLDLYFQCCALSVTTVELATMAATLANAGTNPRTGTKAISRQSLRDVLTLMFTCGLYEQSGLWAYQVGFPAKSGVSGGFFAVVPGVLGVGAYSPRLDNVGNSVRGMITCRSLLQHLGLHVFGNDKVFSALT